jgi:hypothetical protein
MYIYIYIYIYILNTPLNYCFTFLIGMDVLHKAAISIQKIARGRISRVLVAKLLSKKKKGSKGKKGGKKGKK